MCNKALFCPCLLFWGFCSVVGIAHENKANGPRILVSNWKGPIESEHIDPMGRPWADLGGLSGCIDLDEIW
jgi:hypothetical protein